MKDKNISYEIKGQQIMLAPSNIVIHKSSGTKRTIKGIVTDESGAPLPGVSIFNKTNNQFAASDLDGKYTIDAANSDILVFSSIGVIEKSLSVTAGKSAYNIELASDLIALEDVVVTGYQTLSKERATGSFDVIKAEELEKPSTDIGQRLIGSVAGVASKVDVNGNIIFEIRGRTSLETSAQPLVVVDGFAIEGGLNTLNPNDIENITILKDAAAASIWGAKSANGVIVVTSKSNKEKNNDLKVEFNAFWKFSPKMNMDYISPKASSAETVEYEQMGFNTRFFGGFTYPKEDGNGYNELYGYYTGVVQTLNEVRLGYLTEGDARKILNNYRNFNNSRQIKDHILANPFTQQYNLSVMGSTKKTDNVLTQLQHRIFF